MRGLKSTDTHGLFKHEGGAYWGRISVGGKQRYKSFKKADKSAALTALARWRQELERAHAIAGTAAGANDARTVGHFLAELRIEYKNKADLGRGIGYATERIRGLQLTWPELFAIKVKQLTQKQIEAYKNRCQKGSPGVKARSASTTRGNLLFLSLALDMAVKEQAIQVSPMADVKLPGVSRAGIVEPQHKLSPADFDRIVAYMTTPVPSIITKVKEGSKRLLPRFQGWSQHQPVAHP